MKQFLAKLVFEIISNSEHRQFDAQLRWIEAADYTDAIDKSLALGEREEDSFLNMENHKVQWKFIALTNVFAVNDLEHGTEILSCITEEEKGEDYIKLIRQKQFELTSMRVSS